MTRLLSEWLRDSREEQMKWRRRVLDLTGAEVETLAREAAARWADHHKAETLARWADQPEKEPAATAFPSKDRLRCAVVRVTAGQGVISGFSESIGATLDLLGAEVVIPATGDAQGIYEAVCRKADLIWLADDDRFIALNVKTGAMGENDAATAWGYTAALHAMAGGLSGKEVLLAGCGRVGREALDALRDRGARVCLYDRNQEAALALAKDAEILREKKEIRGFQLIFDATDEGGWLRREDLHENFLAAAPGIPLSFDDECVIISRDRIYHDPLQTGTAVMLYMALGGGSDGSHRL